MGLRIIGGALKGKKLYSVRDRSIRPTADRLRESIFNILSHRVLDAVVMDLFAGTGALGIEALSRGAESVVFVDNRKTALSVIRRNIDSCRLDQKANIVRWNIRQNLNCIRSKQQNFDLIFLDPPYDKNLIKPTLLNLDNSHSLKNGACIMVEHSISEPIPTDLFAFDLLDQRKYGKTLVSFLNYVI
ncbi:MAG: 16S rRNA (guanine(966)-N(2))-methyltransferase RsmD [Deltaproteobacteria bacterium]|nr:16S rRNA (guanine(966)-N(2))-methyltransferase RsmD [Deltaproteobacteria bacterium]